MTKPVTIPNTFATATTAIPLSQLDGDFTAVATAINDANTYSNYAADTGSANAYVVTFSGVSTSYSAGLRIQFKAGNANTGASTINVNAQGAKNITYQDASALASGTIAVNSIVDVMYDGTQFLLMNDPAGATGGDVTGPASATDNAVVRFDGTTGKLVQNSVVTIADSTGDVAGVGALTASGNLTLSGGTANGVLYLNGSKVATSGSAVTYNGTTFSTSADASVNGLTVGRGAGAVATNTAVGASALAANTSGAQNTTVGNQAGATTNAAYLVAVGYQAARYNTGDGNTAIGTNALLVSGGVNGTGTNNVAVGKDALYTNTTASNNTAVGYQAGYTNQTGSNNAFFGAYAGYAVTTGQYNTFIGRGDSRSAGDSMTTGSKNTILGAYTGNQGGLDIRTASNQVVISDGDGNPRAYWTDLGGMLVGSVSWTFTNPNTGGASIKGGSQGGGVPIVEIGNTDATSSSDGSPALMCFKNSATTNSNARFIQFSASGTATTMGAIVGAGSGVCAFANFSDISLKKNIQPLSGSLAKIIALKPSSYDMIADDSHVNAGLIAQDVQQVYPEYVVENMSDEGKPPLMGITGGLSGGFISELICAIQEQQAIIESLKARLDAANL